MQKKTLLLIFGGRSDEYDISLISASTVCEHIDTKKYKIIKVGITRDGRWYKTLATPSEIRANEWINLDNRPALLTHDRTSRCLIELIDNSYIKTDIDIIFPVLHGQGGEDGTVQGLFELSGIPYVGCGVASSALCMDKSFTKIFADKLSIPQAKWFSFDRNEYFKDANSTISKIEELFNYPVFIKPSRTGSSVGISKAISRTELINSIKNAFLYDNKIIIEEFINGKEIEVAVFGGNNPTVSVCGEITLGREFYDYKAKYNDDKSVLHIPARIKTDTSELIRNTALTLYKSLDCKCLSRIEFFITKNEKIFFNEINTLPGFTEISMYPKLFAYMGVSIDELIDNLIDFSINKKE